MQGGGPPREYSSGVSFLSRWHQRGGQTRFAPPWVMTDISDPANPSPQVARVCRTVPVLNQLAGLQACSSAAPGSAQHHQQILLDKDACRAPPTPDDPARADLISHLPQRARFGPPSILPVLLYNVRSTRLCMRRMTHGSTRQGIRHGRGLELRIRCCGLPGCGSTK